MLHLQAADAAPSATHQTSSTPAPSASTTSASAASQAEAARLKQAAVAAAARVAEAFPKDALSHALLGSACYNTGRADEAIVHLKKCLELNPDLADAYEVLARIAYDKGDPEKAAAYCQEALKRGAPTPEILNRLGRAQMDLGQSEASIATFERAVRLPESVSESSYLLGQALLQSGNPAGAKSSLQKAIGLQPDHTQAYFGLYTACTRLEQADDAQRYRTKFEELEAADRRTLSDRSAKEETLTGLPMVRKTVARTLFGAGQVYRASEKMELATDLFRQASTLDVDSPIYRAALEGAYVRRKAFAEGLQTFQQLAAEQPENPFNPLFIGRLHVRLQQFAPAVRAYQKVQELAPQWAEGYRALSDLYLRANRHPEEARALASKAVGIEPSAPHYFLLATACLKNGDRAAAAAAARKAVDLDPQEPRYQQLLQQLPAAP